MGPVAHPDDRSRRPARHGPGAHVCRQDHAVDGIRDRRDQPAPGQAGGLQHRARASTRSPCASGSRTSPTCSAGRTPTPRPSSGRVGPARAARAPVCRPVAPPWLSMPAWRVPPRSRRRVCPRLSWLSSSMN
ncbi:MAG: hypothetical protein V9F04_04220 [Dermatophilaceae bacterium]